MADMYFNPKDRDWDEFYNSLGPTNVSPAGIPSGELTSRSVRTVAIDPFTGQPIAAGGANPATLAALNANMAGRGQPARMSTASPEAAADRLPAGSQGLPLNPTGTYGAGNPLVLSALSAQQKANPAVAAANAMASGGIKPGWANPPGFGGAPQFPVTATPQIRQAYAAMVAGELGAQKRYADLLAEAAPMMGKAPGAPAAAPVTRPGPTGVGTNGYIYVDGQNMGYSPEEQARRVAEGKAIAAANAKNPNPTYTVSGDRNDFMPKSVQESVRWQTGY